MKNIQNLINLWLLNKDTLELILKDLYYDYNINYNHIDWVTNDIFNFDEFKADVFNFFIFK